MEHIEKLTIEIFRQIKNSRFRVGDLDYFFLIFLLNNSLNLLRITKSLSDTLDPHFKKG